MRSCTPAPDAVARLEQYRVSLAPGCRPLRREPCRRWCLTTTTPGRAKIDELLLHPVELVSFAFGLPDSAVVAALRKAGSTVIATVTSRAEAELAADRGVDALVVQHSSAGAHSGAFLAGRKPAACRRRRLTWSGRWRPPSTFR